MDTQDSSEKKINIEVYGQNEGFCTTGLPFPLGKVTSLSQLCLHHNNRKKDCSALPLCYWEDGSIKWLNIRFFHTPGETDQYKLMITEPSHPTKTAHTTEHQLLQNHHNKLSISTKEVQFVIELETLSLVAKTNNSQQAVFHIPALSGAVTGHNNQAVTGKLQRWNARTFVNLSSGYDDFIELSLEGCFQNSHSDLPLQFKTVIGIHQSNSFLRIQSSLHNPNPAKHPDGLWDLGDEGSALIKSFMFNVALPENSKMTYQTAPGPDWQPVEGNIAITQHASGGDNWQSPVHVDRDNKVTLKTNGFEVLNNGRQVSHGTRATPTLYSSNNDVSLTIEKFWQNFPTSIEADRANIHLGLFPAHSEQVHEIQGGEKKTHTFWLSFAEKNNNLNWVHSPPIAKPGNDWLSMCAVLPLTSISSEATAITELIENGLFHQHNFFTKREVIDEYGWRNFGDLYADHETAGYQDKQLFVSHYNNQYDPVFGLYKQFFRTGDVRWHELADDLARHVTDIDIYNTEHDRVEYNGGLFWHTDHYVKAFTSTHRSYSKFQGSDSYENRAGSGGPGGQHCYTTGLAIHHLFTGIEDSRQAVLSMAKWITFVYEGTGTCVEFLWALKGIKTPGRKNPISGQYPFDRGTAHYIIALLDCHLITQEQRYLERVEQIICNTIHPEDNIAERNLTHSEGHWFYTVLLQAICRYLQVKRLAGAFDDAFYYARDSLLHYADWMLLSEQPFLEKAEILEFPNDTWTAQDLRKSYVLAAAYYYSPDNKQAYLDKAAFFQTYVADKLSTSNEKHYTRILALLMQNHGGMEYYSTHTSKIEFATRRHNWPKASYQEVSHPVFRIAYIFAKKLLGLSITSEINWIKKRLVK